MTTNTNTHTHNDLWAAQPLHSADDMLVSRRNRETGTLVGLLRDAHEYKLVCLDHDVRSHDWWSTRRQAMQWLSSPTRWCRTCSHDQDADRS